MKAVTKMSVKYLVVLSWLILQFSSLPSKAGIETNGGDGVCAEFLSVFDELVVELSETLLSEYEKSVLQSVKQKRMIVDLKSVPELSLDGVPKDAINFPGLEKPRIEISQSSWARLSKNQKAQLVLHEMLPIAGYNDQNYILSSSFVNKTGGGRKRNIEIARSFLNCRYEELERVTTTDLQRIRLQNFYDLGGNSVMSLCLRGLELLIQAEWDLNRCTQGKTVLSQLEYFFESHLDEPETKKRYIKFKELVLKNGGTKTCSGHYP
ncbi:hypothetical protein [Bdellovibrio sp. HCB337]|uniref:hypothetical protein n=1 Tax=Bdellovibrio sp. HCB337 TaxID=3394358 RepID=UPI0039A44CA9